MSPELKRLLFNYLIDELDTPSPTMADIQREYDAGVEFFGSESKLEAVISTYYYRSSLRPLPPL